MNSFWLMVVTYTNPLLSSQYTIFCTSNVPCVNGMTRFFEMLTWTKCLNRPDAPSRKGDIEMYALPFDAKNGTLSMSTQPCPSALTRWVCRKFQMILNYFVTFYATQRLRVHSNKTILRYLQHIKQETNCKPHGRSTSDFCTQWQRKYFAVDLTIPHTIQLSKSMRRWWNNDPYTFSKIKTKRLVKWNLSHTNTEERLNIHSFRSNVGGLISRMRKFFGSAKSATFKVAVGFFVPGFGYLQTERICGKIFLQILNVTRRTKNNSKYIFF